MSKRGNANTKPPMTAMARGWCNCAPAPIPNASGVRAITAASAVINLGRKRAAIAYSIY